MDGFAKLESLESFSLYHNRYSSFDDNNEITTIIYLGIC